MVGLIVYSYKKGTQKRENTVEKYQKSTNREISVITYISLKLY